jgi:hypothetical protein
MIQMKEAVADPINIELLFTFMVGIKANPKLKIMNSIKNGVRYNDILCKEVTSINIETIGIEVVESISNINNDPKMVIPKNFTKLYITPRFRFSCTLRMLSKESLMILNNEYEEISKIEKLKRLNDTF